MALTISEIAAKYRREKRDQHKQKSEEELAALEEESKILKVTEFVTARESKKDGRLWFN